MAQRVEADPGPDKFKLSLSERSSSFWMRISRELERMLAEARKRNDNNMADRDTQFLRGKIAAYKEILAIGEGDGTILAWSGDDVGTGGVVQPRAR